MMTVGGYERPVYLAETSGDKLEWWLPGDAAGSRAEAAVELTRRLLAADGSLPWGENEPGEPTPRVVCDGREWLRYDGRDWTDSSPYELGAVGFWHLEVEFS